jgi:uncharacterized protein
MWDFPGGRTGGNRYLVLGLGTGQAADLAVPPDRNELIAYGPLLSDDELSSPTQQAPKEERRSVRS